MRCCGLPALGDEVKATSPRRGFSAVKIVEGKSFAKREPRLLVFLIIRPGGVTALPLLTPNREILLPGASPAYIDDSLTMFSPRRPGLMNEGSSRLQM